MKRKRLIAAKVEAVKSHQAATTSKPEALLPSILDKAFKGELFSKGEGCAVRFWG